MTPDEIRRISDLLAAAVGGDSQAQEDFIRELGTALAAPFTEGLMAGTEAIGGAIEFGAASARAIGWARDHAAELVTQVDETSRQLIQDLVTRELEGGVTVQDLTDDLMQAFGDFSQYRAERIARTETAFAFNQGTIAGYRDADVGFVEVLDGPGCLPDGHDDTADEADPDQYGVQEERQANGQIWTLDEAADYPVGHPNCVRAFAAVTPAPPAEEE